MNRNENTIGTAVDVRDSISVDEFYGRYVNREPVVFKGALVDLPAASKWTIEHLATIAPDLPARLKTGNLAEGQTETRPMSEYAELVTDLVAGEQKASGTPPPYLHDVPLFSMIPSLRADMEPFPTQYLPKFFRDPWWVFPQFFVGPPGAVTPLHFDTLQTHNLFFQLNGKKRFLIIHPDHRKYCYMYNWRWSHVDAEQPDYQRHPKFAKAGIRECVVEGGDMLYMPPGTLHHVRSLTASISFNIDWHDPRSAIRGLTAVLHGMPIQNLRYNFLFMLGVCARVPLRTLMPALKSYFYYIS